MRPAAIVLLVFGVALATSARGQEVRVIEQADISGIYGMPTEDSDIAWTPVALPHNWYRNPPLSGSLAWYRIILPVEYETLGYSLYLPRLPVTDLSVYVNGRHIWQLSHRSSSAAAASAVLVAIPAFVLQAGRNVIYLRVIGWGPAFHGMPRVYFGETRTLARRATVRNLLQGQMIHTTALALGAIGVLALVLWLRTGRDPVLFWYGIAGVALLVSTILWYLTLWSEERTPWRTALIFLRFNGYLLPLMIVHLRLAGRRLPVLEGALWLALAVAVVDLAYPKLSGLLSWNAWVIGFGVLPALFVVPLLLDRRLLRDPTVILLVVADAAAVLANVHDLALRYGWIDFDRPYFIYYVAPFIMLAAGAPILRRLLAGYEAAKRTNVELEERVAAKAGEIEATHARLRRVEHEQALAAERRRIMADMHDGLGSRLVGLLSIAQSGKAEAKELGEGIAAALDELRLAIDALEPVEGDVGVVLGNVRHRMRSVFEHAGVRFLWNVSELPRMGDLTPARVLAIQRLLLEVFTNAIKHAGAKTVAVFAARLPGVVHIVIEDDGRGFDPTEGGPGHGLRNIRLRAGQAGGSVTVETVQGKGTRVTLALPLDGRQPASEGAYPVQGIPPAPSSA